MCGIIGIASRDLVSEREWLSIGRDAMIHRGPDSFGEFWSQDGRVGLGHRRLSIIDLSPGGHQPMMNAEKSICVVLNGEVYNFKYLRQVLQKQGFKFVSDSDTEVLLFAYEHWGEDCLDYLEGMYAFAIYDSRKNILFCARDCAGEKPFFYYHEGRSIRFASELKGLLADTSLPRHIDQEALDYLLSFNYVPGERSILKGFNKLPPGHKLVYDINSSKIQISQFWKLPNFDSLTDLSTNCLVDQLEELLVASVANQLTADVPVGILLSGGLDSSIVTAIAAKHVRNIKTYTVSFPGSPRYDETKHANLVAKAFGTDHTTIVADEISPEILVKLAHQYDEPMIDSSMIPTFVISRVISTKCRVALGGDGADELFGGYFSASQVACLEKHLSYLSFMPRRWISGLAMDHLPRSFRGRQKLINFGFNCKSDILPVHPFLSGPERSSLVSSSDDYVVCAEKLRSARISNCSDSVSRMTRFDFCNYLPEDILVKTDRASMLNSLEQRAPFLDRRIIEFAFRSVPTYQKATCGRKKILLKELGAKLLPKDFSFDRKQGFGVPLQEWFGGKRWGSYVQEVLLAPDSLFSKKSVNYLFDQVNKSPCYAETLFGLCMIELWRKLYKVAVK
ncbi:MAG: asparagine synthase (glutamine-hydrolyzing) [Planctomycetales bacterium]|nr:asparagine synthase (glutamine-hydrolyzing) [Planctomycetales bacterium]